MAINWDILKAHYLQTNWVTQLDSLALNLMRIQVPAHSGTDESVEITSLERVNSSLSGLRPGSSWRLNLTFATELLELQRLFSQWKLSWSELWANESKRQEIAILADNGAIVETIAVMKYK